MRLLITGWQGQLAKAMTQSALRRSDVSACAVGRPGLDICQIGTIERAMADVRPDVVINTAAYTAVDAAESDEALAFALNAEGARLMAESAAQRGIPIIHISTDYVFDGTKSTPYVETDAPSPANAYGRTKLAGEIAVAAANPRHVILRTAWVYSAEGKNFLRTMLRLADERDEVRVVADQLGSPTYAPHLADAILSIATRLSSTEGPRAWGLYHAAGSGETTWHDFAVEIFRQRAAVGGKAPRVVAITSAEFPTPARRPANSRLDCTKLERTFGLRLPAWPDGVRACFTALRNAETKGPAA
jgi:dTDP-4-dehydrorhamnose reductase